MGISKPVTNGLLASNRHWGSVVVDADVVPPRALTLRVLLRIERKCSTASVRPRGTFTVNFPSGLISVFGRLLDERLGKWNFWLMFIGFNVTFLPLHMLGLLGMPRRIYTYSNGGLWEGYNLVSTIGSGIMAIGVFLFLVNVWRTSVARSGVRATNDPWLADTLEWYTTSPPPPHNFDTVPYVTSPRPLRDLRRKLAEQT